MHVVITSADRCDSRLVGALLAIGGHQVDFCHPPDRLDVACAGSLGRCPLAAVRPDVLVDVHFDEGPLTWDESGVLCAALRQIPVVVAGPPSCLTA
jgi:hypothetical protein